MPTTLQIPAIPANGATPPNHKTRGPTNQQALRVLPMQTSARMTGATVLALAFIRTSRPALLALQTRMPVLTTCALAEPALIPSRTIV